MKYVLILACLVLYVAVIEAQTETCNGRIRRVDQNCEDRVSAGHNRTSKCNQYSNRNMWYFNEDRNRCIRFAYRGCGGNGNRYCSQRECVHRCRGPRSN